MNQLEMKLQRALEEALARQETGVGSVLVIRGGAEAAYAQAGTIKSATGAPVRRDSIFRLYSQSKPVTAAAAMLLMERGVIDLLDPVSKYLPGFKDCSVISGGRYVPANLEPTIYHLLSMTAGCAYPDHSDAAGRAAEALFAENQKRMDEGCGMSTVEFCNRIGQLPLTFHPGDSFRYSTCADVLGAVIEVASGKRFGQFLQDEFFTPLGMKDTGFFVPPEKADRLSETWWRRRGQPLTVFTKPHLCVEATTKAPAFESGGAGLYSTLDDYAAFAQMLLNGGEYKGRRILAKATVDFMTQPVLDDNQLKSFCGTWLYAAGYSYGKLMRVCTDPGKTACLSSPGEYGWDGWLGTYFINMPAHDTTFLYMTSLLDEGENSGLIRKLRNIVLSD